MYAAFVLLAVVFARHAPEDERRDAFLLSVALAANWLFCGWAYADNPPHRWLGVSAPDLWAVADAALAASALALTAARRWWGWTVWFAATCQVGFHLARLSMADATYHFWLDRLLDAQLATFIFLGGRGAYDRIAGGLPRLLPSDRMGGGSSRVLASRKAT